MRHLTCLAFAAFVYAAPARGQSGALRPEPVDAATRRSLIEARDAVWRAWFAGDSAALDRLLPPALAAGGRNGWEARDASIASARSFAASGGRLVALTFDSTSIRLRGDVAVLEARYHLVLATGGGQTTRSGTAVEVFVRQGGQWVNPFWYLE